MKKLIALLQLLLLFYGLQAQRYTLSGRILSQGNNLPVEFATLTILTKDSIVLTGGLTDSTGSYHIDGVGVKDPIVKAGCIGYQNYLFRPVLVNGTNILPDIFLPTEAKQIKEVRVQAAQQNTAVHIDKQVINAGQFQNAVSGTGLDVLKNLSSVTVNTEGQIKYRGSEGFVVLVNGKPSNRAAADILAQLPANEIASVEIITSGSAVYDADGKTGIINIITKKNLALGWNVTANGMLGGISPPQYGADLTFGYNAKKWSFYISGDYRRFDYNGFRYGDLRTIYQDTLTYHPSKGIRDFQTAQYSVRAGGTVNIDKRNTLDIGAYYGFKETIREADLHYQDFFKTGSNFNLFDNTWVTPQSTYFNLNNFVRKGTFFTANLTYAHNFTDKSKLSLLGQYEYSVLGGPVDDQDLVENSSQVLLHVRNNENSPLNSFRAQADFIKPLRENLKLETGLQFRYLDQTGDFQYLTQDLNTGIYYNTPTFSNHLDLKQSIEAAYLQINGNKGNFTYNAGLRGEYMRRSLADVLDSTTSNYNKFDFFPTVQGLWKLKNDQRLKLSYNRRIDRPTLKLIAPFKIQEHSETVEYGDPNARPEIGDNVDFSYTKNWKWLTLTSSIYYNHVLDKIFRVNSIYNRTSLLRLFTNAGNTNSAGVELTANFTATKWLKFYVAGNVYEYIIQGTYYSVQQNSNSINYNVNGNSTINITKNLRFQFDVSYVSRTITEQGNDDHLLLANTSLKYSLLNNKLYLGLKLQNVFNTNSQTITTQTPVFYSATNYVKYDRLLLFTVGYTFNESANNKKANTLKTDVGEKDF